MKFFTVIALLFAAAWAQDAGVTEINCEDYVFPHESFTQTDPSKVFLAVDATAPGPFKTVGLTKYTTVFGVRILAHKSVPDDKILHTANLLAQLLDNDQDGAVDHPLAQKQLIERYATLVIVSDETFTNFLLSPKQGEGLPEALKFCPFAIDFEEVSRIQPGESPESICPDHLFEKDRTLGFVTDHIVGRSWPLHLTEEPEKAESSPDYQKMRAFYDKATADKNFEVEKTGCPEEDLENCGMVMFASWAASSMMGVDRCYCEAVGAYKLCAPSATQEKYPSLVEFLKEKVMKKFPDGHYNPSDESAIVSENIDTVRDEI